MNKVAFTYISLPIAWIFGANLLVMLLGFVLGGVTWRGRYRLRRATYLVVFACLLLANAVVQLYWIDARTAHASGYLERILIVTMTGLLAFGYAVWIAAAARSRDIRGDHVFAPLAFVPFANLYLMVAKGPPVSSTKTPDVKARPWLRRRVSDPLLILAALLVLVLSNALIRRMEVARDPDAWAASE